jgi:hypothetical protein
MSWLPDCKAQQLGESMVKASEKSPSTAKHCQKHQVFPDLWRLRAQNPLGIDASKSTCPLLIFLDELSAQQDLQFNSVLHFPLFPDVFRCFQMFPYFWWSEISGHIGMNQKPTLVPRLWSIHIRTSSVSYFGLKTILGWTNPLPHWTSPFFRTPSGVVPKSYAIGSSGCAGYRRRDSIGLKDFERRVKEDKQGVAPWWQYEENFENQHSSINRHLN